MEFFHIVDAIDHTAGFFTFQSCVPVLGKQDDKEGKLSAWTTIVKSIVVILYLQSKIHLYSINGQYVPAVDASVVLGVHQCWHRETPDNSWTPGRKLRCIVNVLFVLKAF